LIKAVGYVPVFVGVSLVILASFVFVMRIDCSKQSLKLSVG